MSKKTHINQKSLVKEAYINQQEAQMPVEDVWRYNEYVKRDLYQTKVTCKRDLYTSASHGCSSKML